MNLEELVKKVTSDTSEAPYITLEDVQDVVNEQKAVNDSLASITAERDKLKDDLAKKSQDYETLRGRIVDSVLKGESLTPKGGEPKPIEHDRDNLTWDDLLKGVTH